MGSEPGSPVALPTARSLLGTSLILPHVVHLAPVTSVVLAVASTYPASSYRSNATVPMGQTVTGRAELTEVVGVVVRDVPVHMVSI
jgi:hypothetical protein